ncbi:MAG TPA: class I SAM-dependent methyltransferase [Humisphaera sp.]
MPSTKLNTPCPACGSPLDPPFYAQPGVPQQSNLLLRTQAEALAMPTGDLALAFCPACGFISNTAFDFGTQELSDQYEASQGFSPTFGAFAKSLARTWADRYGLAGKTAVEIGCGKGEFLALLCREAKCRGVGFDPTLDPARLPDTVGLDVAFRAEMFDERSAATLPDVDFVCCRHTLEHIPDVGAFVGMLRRAVTGRPNVRVGFEVPDTLRVLTEGAFWDVYYEHCSYFTPGSVARLFGSCGFDVLDVRREFHGQYVILEGAPREPRGSAPGPDGAAPTTLAQTTNDLDSLRAAVAAFPGMVKRTVDHWRTVIESTRAAGKRVAVWGASSKAVGFLSALGYTHEQVPAAVDINPHKQGTYLPTSGVPIVSPASLVQNPVDLVILMNPIYTAEVTADLNRLGVRADVVAM